MDILDTIYKRRSIRVFVDKPVEKELITEETALAYASRKGIVGRGIDSVKSGRGEATTDIEELEMDVQYGKKKT